uniref:Protein krueppel n=1 Tax=Anopheles farauti TaxID=69004 RepID=A0A182QMA6_9DIPT
MFSLPKMAAKTYDTVNEQRVLLYRELFCRICLQYSKDSLIPVHAEIKNTTLLDMFIQLTTFELDDNDAFPVAICEQCVSKLTLAYNIREEFISQTELLLKLVVQKQIIKYYEQFPLDIKPNVTHKTSSKAAATPLKEANIRPAVNSRAAPIPVKIMKPKEVVLPSPPQVVEAKSELSETVMNNSSEQENDDSVFDVGNWGNDDSSSETSLDEDDWSYSLNPITPKMLAELKQVSQVRKKYPSNKPMKLAKQDRQDESKEFRNQYSTTTCHICDQKHDTIEQRDDHFRLHIHMLPYECGECFADPPPEDPDLGPPPEPVAPQHIVLRSVVQLNSHLMMHRMPHKCDQCYRRFMSPYLLQHHMWNYHEHSKEGLTCEWCGKRYFSRRPFQEHVRRHRNAVTEQFKCDTCGRAFGTKALLRRHIMVHTGERNHKCTYCPRRFSRRCNLLDHLRLHTGERCHKCTECSQAFNTKTSLEKHQRNYHSPENGVPSRIDRNMYTLQADGTKLYRCKHADCSFTSTQSTVMSQHRLRHNKPCVCEICGQRFVAPKFVRKHINQMHSGKPRKQHARHASSALKKIKQAEPVGDDADISVDESMGVVISKMDEDVIHHEEEDTWTRVKDGIIRAEWNAGDLNVVHEYEVDFDGDVKEIET